MRLSAAPPPCSKAEGKRPRPPPRTSQWIAGHREKPRLRTGCASPAGAFRPRPTPAYWPRKKNPTGERPRAEEGKKKSGVERHGWDTGPYPKTIVRHHPRSAQKDSLFAWRMAAQEDTGSFLIRRKKKARKICECGNSGDDWAARRRLVILGAERQDYFCRRESFGRHCQPPAGRSPPRFAPSFLPNIGPFKPSSLVIREE